MHAATLQYRVEPVGRKWRVAFCHAGYGLFETRRAAIAAALRDAARVGNLGHSVSVTVARPEGCSDLKERILRPRFVEPRRRGAEPGSPSPMSVRSTHS